MWHMVVNQISMRELFHRFKSNIPISRMLTVTPSPAFALWKLKFTAMTECINMEVSLLSTSSRAEISLNDGISVSYYLPSCSSFLDGSTNRLQPSGGKPMARLTPWQRVVYCVENKCTCDKIGCIYEAEALWVWTRTNFMAKFNECKKMMEREGKDSSQFGKIKCP